MNAHPKDRGERRKKNATEKRRKDFLNEALKRQEEQDAKRKEDGSTFPELPQLLDRNLLPESESNTGRPGRHSETPNGGLLL